MRTRSASHSTAFAADRAAAEHTVEATACGAMCRSWDLRASLYCVSVGSTDRLALKEEKTVRLARTYSFGTGRSGNCAVRTPSGCKPATS